MKYRPVRALPAAPCMADRLGRAWLSSMPWLNNPPAAISAKTIMTAFTGDSDDTAVAESTVAAVAGAATKVSDADPAIVGAGFPARPPR